MGEPHVGYGLERVLPHVPRERGEGAVGEDAGGAEGGAGDCRGKKVSYAYEIIYFIFFKKNLRAGSSSPFLSPPSSLDGTSVAAPFSSDFLASARICDRENGN